MVFSNKFFDFLELLNNLIDFAKLRAAFGEALRALWSSFAGPLVKLRGVFGQASLLKVKKHLINLVECNSIVRFKALEETTRIIKDLSFSFLKVLFRWFDFIGCRPSQATEPPKKKAFSFKLSRRTTGFEPANHGVTIQCLTTWLRPPYKIVYKNFFEGEAPHQFFSFFAFSLKANQCVKTLHDPDLFNTFQIMRFIQQILKLLLKSFT